METLLTIDSEHQCAIKYFKEVDPRELRIGQIVYIINDKLNNIIVCNKFSDGMIGIYTNDMEYYVWYINTYDTYLTSIHGGYSAYILINTNSTYEYPNTLFLPNGQDLIIQISKVSAKDIRVNDLICIGSELVCVSDIVINFDFPDSEDSNAQEYKSEPGLAFYIEDSPMNHITSYVYQTSKILYIAQLKIMGG